DAPRYATEDIRQALALSPDVPIVAIDARDRESAKAGLVAVAEYALSRVGAQLR
ncbi:ATP-binding protein, partial [Rhodococcus kronopolitis]